MKVHARPITMSAERMAMVSAIDLSLVPDLDIPGS
jgi:hypothetical protein